MYFLNLKLDGTSQSHLKPHNFCSLGPRWTVMERDLSKCHRLPTLKWIRCFKGAGKVINDLRGDTIDMVSYRLKVKGMFNRRKLKAGKAVLKID